LCEAVHCLQFKYAVSDVMWRDVLLLRCYENDWLEVKSAYGAYLAFLSVGTGGAFPGGKTAGAYKVWFMLNG
jgi:hypothetical protein